LESLFRMRHQEGVMALEGVVRLGIRLILERESHYQRQKIILLILSNRKSYN
jgi:hypothetical protein